MQSSNFNTLCINRIGIFVRMIRVNGSDMREDFLIYSRNISPVSLLQSYGFGGMVQMSFIQMSMRNATQC